MQNLEWYQQLDKPLLSPPDNIFTPVWTILYVMIALSFFIFIKTKNSTPKKLPLLFFSIQLFLNFCWPVAFFGMKNIELGLVVLMLLIFFLSITIYTFYNTSKSSAFLLMPYFLWCIFALYLNTGLLILNRNIS